MCNVESLNGRGNDGERLPSSLEYDQGELEPYIEKAFAMIKDRAERLSYVADAAANHNLLADAKNPRLLGIAAYQLRGEVQQAYTLLAELAEAAGRLDVMAEIWPNLPDHTRG